VAVALKCMTGKWQTKQQSWKQLGKKHVQTGRLLGLFFVLFGKAFPVSHFSSADCRYDDYMFSYDDRTTSRRGLRWSVVVPDDVSGRSGRGGCSGGGVVVVM